jgi:hypothetical protein
MPPNDKHEALREALVRATLHSSVSKIADSKTLEEEEDLDRQQQKAAIQGLVQDIDERKKYATYFFWLACSWLLTIILVVLLQGFGGFLEFRLSDNVVLALIGSTTVNVLGILYVVSNYLFPKR